MTFFLRFQYSKHIENATDWESKKKVVSLMLSKITLRENIDHQIFDTYFHMLKAISEYEKLPSDPLQSLCTLIRCVEGYLDLPVDESYDLTQVCIQNAIIKYKIEMIVLKLMTNTFFFFHF